MMTIIGMVTVIGMVIILGMVTVLVTTCNVAHPRDFDNPILGDGYFPKGLYQSLGPRIGATSLPKACGVTSS